MRFGHGLRPKHFLLIAPEWAPGAGAQFSAEAYVQSLVDSGVNCVEFYVKVPFQVRDGRVELTVDQIEISAVVALERS